MAPNRAGRDFFLLIHLADILGRMDFDFENFYFLDFLGSQLGPGPDLKKLSAP